MNTAGLILVSISGICWTIVYIELIFIYFYAEKLQEEKTASVN